MIKMIKIMIIMMKTVMVTKDGDNVMNNVNKYHYNNSINDDDDTIMTMMIIMTKMVIKHDNDKKE